MWIELLVLIFAVAIGLLTYVWQTDSAKMAQKGIVFLDGTITAGPVQFPTKLIPVVIMALAFLIGLIHVVKLFAGDDDAIDVRVTGGEIRVKSDDDDDD